MHDDTATATIGNTTDGEPARYEWTDGESPSTAVASAIATETNRDVADVPQLYRFVDTDALDALVTGRDGHPENVRLSFTCEEIHVVVDSNGSILLRPL
jgi:hypothetical protein